MVASAIRAGSRPPSHGTLHSHTRRSSTRPRRVLVDPPKDFFNLLVGERGHGHMAVPIGPLSSGQSAHVGRDRLPTRGILDDALPRHIGAMVAPSAPHSPNSSIVAR